MPPPTYLQLRNSIDLYGASSVLGRLLYAHEIIRMTVSKNVYDAYKSRTTATDWAEWAKKNQDAAELLANVERLLNE